MDRKVIQIPRHPDMSLPHDSFHPLKLLPPPDSASKWQEKNVPSRPDNHFLPPLSGSIRFNESHYRNDSPIFTS